MTDPQGQQQDQQQEPNELDLDAETVRDLELDDEQVEAVLGGSVGVKCKTTN